VFTTAASSLTITTLPGIRPSFRGRPLPRFLVTAAAAAAVAAVKLDAKLNSPNDEVGEDGTELYFDAFLLLVSSSFLWYWDHSITSGEI